MMCYFFCFPSILCVHIFEVDRVFIRSHTRYAVCSYVLYHLIRISFSLLAANVFLQRPLFLYSFLVSLEHSFFLWFPFFPISFSSIVPSSSYRLIFPVSCFGRIFSVIAIKVRARALSHFGTFEKAIMLRHFVCIFFPTLMRDPTPPLVVCPIFPSFGVMQYLYIR